MFENIIAQDAALQLRDDFGSRRLAPSMLFFGPAMSGKGSAALELARALSCEKGAAWNCACPACVKHRALLHGDILMLGKRAFQAEIAASRAALLRELASTRQINQPSFALFIRSIRKLTARFSPVLWEDDTKLGKLAASLQAIEEGLDDLDALAAAKPEGMADAEIAGLEKLSEALQKNASALEAEGISAMIPINQIRRASYWGRLSPQGRRKTLLIENADRMQEGARNCLLKILEEPPDSLNIVLCAQRRDAIMPTLLSRLRPYRFLKRGQAEEGEVIRRIFKEPSEAAASLGLASYIDSFLSQPGEKIRALAAFWIASVARFTLLSLKKSGKAPEELVSLGLYCSPLAEAAGLGKPASASEACSKVLLESGNFEDRSFSRFLRYCLELVSQALQKTGLNPQAIPYIDIWRKNAAEADAAMGTWNQNAPMALEAFFFRLKREMGGICEMNK